MDQKLGFLFGIIAAVAWGIVYASTEEILEHGNPIASLVVFYISGALVLLPVGIFLHKESLSVINNQTWPLIKLVVNFLIAEAFIMLSIKYLGGVEAGLVEISYPLWTALFLLVFRNTKPSLATIVGGVFIFAGLIIMTTMKKKWG